MRHNFYRGKNNIYIIMKELKKYDRMAMVVFAFLAVALFIVQACNPGDGKESGPAAFRATPYEFPEMPYFPKNLNIPADNPMTVEGVELGRYLFYDGRLAGRAAEGLLMSCATCHIQEKGFEAGIDHPVFSGGRTFGLSGKPAPNNMLPVVNTVFNHNGYFWNGFINESNNQLGSASYNVPAREPYHFKNIESVVWMAIVAPHEMDGDIQKSVDAIGNIDIYPSMFEKAFGTPEVNIDRISKAIAQYVRSIVSYRSKFHKWLRRQAELSPQELRGHDLFFSEDGDCFHCHGGSVLMTTNLYYNNAKDRSFSDPRDRYSVSGDPMDIGAYRAPSLINIEVTAPYMHDGRFASLDEAFGHYSEGLVYSDFVHPLMKAVREGGVRLNQSQRDDLKAFLLTLTDRELLNDPAFSCPPELMEWSGQ